MKQFHIISLSSKGLFIVQDNNKNNFQYPIEGFKVNTALQYRHYFNQFLGQTIQCTLNKNSTHIRYQNLQFLTQKITVGAMQIVQKQLDESKIYSNDQKNKLSKIIKVINNDIKIVDLITNRKQLIKYFPRGQQITGKLEYFCDQIVISLNKNNQLIYVPLKLKNINTMFCCLQQFNYASFFSQNKILKVKIDRPIYNLVQKRFQIHAELQSNIQLNILKSGWGITNQSTLVKTHKDVKPQNYLQAQVTSKEQHQGIFSKNTQILSFIYAKNNFVGQISDVFDGYVFQVIRKGSDQKLKIQLAMVRSPVSDEVGASHSRQFARKQLIGEEVNVYLHKDTGLNITGSIIRTKDSKDIQSFMVQQGWCFVRQQFVNSILCIKLNQLEKRAKQKLRGLHCKDLGVFRPEDLTVPNNQKQQFYVYRRLQILKTLSQNQVGVLDGLVDHVTYRVWLEDKNLILKVKLQGVLGHNINPQLEQVKAMKESLKNLYQRKLKKRSINVNITNYIKEGNSFVGTITFIGGQALQQILLQSSYVYADKENGTKESYRALQTKARSQKKGIWSPNLINFEPVNPLQLQKQRFKGKCSWVEDGQSIFIQPQSNYETLDKIFAELNRAKFNKVSKQQLVIGGLYAAPYDGDLYRARIQSIKGKKVKVLFIDWGNREIIDEGNFWQLPETLKFIQKQAIKAKLYLVRSTKNEQHLDRIRGELINGQQFIFRKQKNEYVTLLRNKQDINLLLIERGIVKSNTAMASEKMREKITKIEQNLFRNRIGVWEWSDEEEISSNDSFDDD